MSGHPQRNSLYEDDFASDIDDVFDSPVRDDMHGGFDDHAAIDSGFGNSDFAEDDFGAPGFGGDDGFQDDFASGEFADPGFGGGTNDEFAGYENAPVHVNMDAPRKQLMEGQHTWGDAKPEGGDRQLPAISVFAFCERRATSQLIDVASRDRRMGRATVEIHEGGIDAALQYLEGNTTPNLLLLECTAPAREMLQKIDQLAEYCDDSVQVVVIGATNDIQLYRELVSRGVSEYLVPPIQPVQLIRSISNLFADPDAPFVGRTIAVVGAKGGVGASSIAHNLAWTLTANANLNAALLDLDLSFGTTALDFNHESAQTVADALLAPERIDDTVIERLMSPVTDRLSLFTAPASVSQVLDIDPEAYNIVIEGVRRKVPYLILDLPHVWNHWMVNTLTSADEVIIVCLPDLASLRNAKNIMDKMNAERPNDSPPRIIINMSGVPRRPEISVRDFAAAVGVEPIGVIPFEPELFGNAANAGQMITEINAQAKASLEIDALGAILTGREIVAPKKSFMQKMMGK